MKRAIIIHAWDSGPDQHWYRDEEVLLKNKGFEVLIPDMLGGEWPKQGEWVDVIESLQPDENTVLLGHSLGAPAILRYLEKATKKVGLVIMIAGFAEDLGIEQTANFFVDSFDWDNIRKNADKFVVLNQINDPWVPLGAGKRLVENLGVELTPVEGNNHFDTMDLDLINKELE